MAHLTYGSELPVMFSGIMILFSFLTWSLQDNAEKIAAVSDAQIGLLSDVSLLETILC